MLRRSFIKNWAAAGLVGAVPPSTIRTPAGGTGKRKPRIMFNHDGRHGMIYMYEPPIQKEEYEAGVDEFLGTPVEALMFGLGDGRTMLHDTKVGELWGHNVRQWPEPVFQRAARNARALIAAGHDPLRIICDRAHANGLLIYPALWVQMDSGERGRDVRSSDFRFDHKHLEIGAGGGIDPSFPGKTGLDFKHKEVQDERFAVIEETLTRYPVDGFDLNLNLMPYYFRPDEVEAGRKVMTSWITRVYRAVKKSGAERELAIRIPASLEKCSSVGLDIQEWIRQGIVDVLIGESHWSFWGLDQTADFRPLVAAARGSQCRVHAVLASNVDSDRRSHASIEMIRAAACNYWDQGIDGLYVGEWLGNWPFQASFYEKLREMPHPDAMAARDKVYFIPTVMGRYPKPDPALQLPRDLKVNEPVKVEWSIADDLPRWHKRGRVHKVLLRMRVLNTNELDQLSFRLNGNTLPDSLLRKINETYKLKAPRYRVFGYWYIFRLDPEHFPKRGKNRLEVTLTRRDPDLAAKISLRDVEMEIQYLRGKNFGRDQDPDLET